MRILAYCSWFRPTLGRDCAEELLLGLERRGHTLVGVISYHTDMPWLELCARRGWNPIPTLHEFGWPMSRWSHELETNKQAQEKLESWLKPLEDLKPDIGFTFFASWVPPAMASLPKLGFMNFHPAPLPQLRGYFPEDLALLKGLKECGGTLHRVDRGIDEGAVLAYTQPAPTEFWDTPDSLMQRVSEWALPDIWKLFDQLEKGKVEQKVQNPDEIYEASYEALYSESHVDWARDLHAVLHRRFQVFRGQDHRMLLKASWNSVEYTIWDWELHTGNYIGNAGEVLGSLSSSGGRIHPLVIRTLEGLCVIWEYEKYQKEEGSPAFVDRKRMDSSRVLPSGVRHNQAKEEWFHPWRQT